MGGHWVAEIIRATGHTVGDWPDRPLPFVTGPCDRGVYWRHLELVQRLESTSPNQHEPLWVDVTALQLVSSVIEAAFARHGLPRKRRRKGTDADHADRAEAAKIYLASRLGQRVSLDELARAVHTSPFHLCRIFHERTGMPVHRYHTRLRLRASLEPLAGGGTDLTALALALGFASHSHFTDAFRREFGCTPCALRRAVGRGTLDELSKNLKV
jgi:AraC-like DNA-binding protein